MSEAAQRLPPVRFVDALADLSIPAGLELRKQDRFAGSSETVIPDSPARSVEELARLFSAAHSDYSATVVDGTMVVRPAQNRSEYLDGAAPLLSVTVRGLMRVTEKLFAPLNPGLDAEGARAGSVLGPVGVEVDRGENLEIRLDTRGKTVLETLTAIARATGHPWFVVTDSATPPHILRAGFVHRYGTTTEATVLERPASR